MVLLCGDVNGEYNDGGNELMMEVREVYRDDLVPFWSCFIVWTVNISYCVVLCCVYCVYECEYMRGTIIVWMCIFLSSGSAIRRMSMYICEYVHSMNVWVNLWVEASYSYFPLYRQSRNLILKFACQASSFKLQAQARSSISERDWLISLCLMYRVHACVYASLEGKEGTKKYGVWSWG